MVIKNVYADRALSDLTVHSPISSPTCSNFHWILFCNSKKIITSTTPRLSFNLRVSYDWSFNWKVENQFDSKSFSNLSFLKNDSWMFFIQSMIFEAYLSIEPKMKEREKLTCPMTLFCSHLPLPLLLSLSLSLSLSLTHSTSPLPSLYYSLSLSLSFSLTLLLLTRTRGVSSQQNQSFHSRLDQNASKQAKAKARAVWHSTCQTGVVSLILTHWEKISVTGFCPWQRD